MSKKLILTSLFYSLLMTHIIAQNSRFSWVNQFGGLSFDTGLAIRTDSSGNVFTVGGFSDTTDFDPGPGVTNLVSIGDQDIFILKNDSTGKLIWVKQMGGTGLDQGKDLAFDSNNNLISVGIFENTVDFDPDSGISNLTSSGNYDIFIQKLNKNGNLIWVKRIGGSGFDVPESIVIDNANNIYITGDFSSNVDFDPNLGTVNKSSSGGSDIFVLKLDSNGNFLWVNNLGGSSLDDGTSIVFDKDQLALYTTGQFTGTADFDPGSGITNLNSNGDKDIFIQKLDTAGNLLWVKQMGGTNADFGNSITIDDSNNIVTTGYFQGTVDFDPDTGTTNLTSNGSRDIFIQKLDTSGNLIWVKQIGGSNSDIGYSVATDLNANIYTIGHFTSVVDFDPGIGIMNQTVNGISDIFILKLGPLGNFVWVKQMGGSSFDFGLDIALDRSGSIYTTGGFETTVDFDPGIGLTNLTSNGSRDIFIQKLSQTFIVGLKENTFRQNPKVYPNPTKGNITIEFPSTQETLTIQLYSISGKLLEKREIKDTYLIPIKLNQPNGVYLLKIATNEGKKAIIRLVKQ